MDPKDLDEHLETLWHMLENDELDARSFAEHTPGHDAPKVLEEMRENGLIENEDDSIVLTGTGREKAAKVIRCHRLAERLQADVLGIDIEAAETGACEFEHVVAPQLVESICTLLGHPRQCPHGRPIPEGRCCREGKKDLLTAVLRLAEAEVGKSYKVAYLNTASNSRMHKFIHFGIVPGSELTLHQTHPAFVIRTENGQLALEEEIAAEIYVWKRRGTS
ncbi:metal-dependent transcriptional regulator [Elusimicrobiota bacterium]